jgi:hypothetical protein
LDAAVQAPIGEVDAWCSALDNMGDTSDIFK